MLDNIKIGKKLVGGFLIVAFISIVIGFVGYLGMGTMGEHVDELANVLLPSVEKLGVLKDSQTALKTYERTLLVKGIDPERQQRQFKLIEETSERYNTAYKEFAALDKSKEEEEVWKKYQEAFADYKGDFDRGISLLRDYHRTLRDEEYNKASELILDVTAKKFYKAEDVIDELIDINNKECEIAELDAEAARVARLRLF